MRIDLGSGKAKTPGHIGIDIMEGSDIEWDLNKGLPHKIVMMDFGGGIEKQPMKDFFTKPGTIEGIRSSMLLEHLNNIIPLMNDCYKLMAPGALFEISVPHKDSWEAYADPTHVRFFVEQSFLYFAKDSPFAKEQEEYAITARFEVVRCERGTGVDSWQIFVVLKR